MQANVTQTLAALEARRMRNAEVIGDLPPPQAPFRRNHTPELDRYVPVVPRPRGDAASDDTLVDSDSTGPSFRSSSSTMPSVWQLFKGWLRRLCGGGHDQAQGQR